MLNYLFLIPEIYLTSIIVIFIGFSVIIEKINGFNQQRFNFRNLIIISLSFLIPLLFYLKNLLIDLDLNYLNLLSFNSSIMLIKLFIILTSIAILFLFLNPLNEILILILLIILGLFIIISSQDLIIFYLGLELMSLSLYILACIDKNRQFSTEAGLKYLILGALSSGFYLFGSSLIYTTTGKTNYLDICLFGYDDTILIGSFLIIISLLFKLGSAPFHFWIPDVYEGAPTKITALFAILPKFGLIYALIIFLYNVFINEFLNIQSILLITGLLSIFIGSVSAINQTKFKRILAYSAIGHMGFMIIGLSIGTLESIQATITYYLIYIIMSYNIFTIVNNIYKNNAKTFVGELIGYSRKNPLLFYTLALTLLSMAGIPPLAGFISKYLIIINIIGNELIMIAGIAIILSVISAFYYIRIIQYSWFKYNKEYIENAIIWNIKKTEISVREGIIIGMTTYMIITLMINPSIITNISFEIVNIILK